MPEITYQDVCDYLSVKRNLALFIKHSDYDFLIRLHNKLVPAVAMLEEKQRKDMASQKLRDDKRQELLALINSKGFSIDDLNAGVSKPSARRPMKYQYIDKGQRKEWSGVGRTPRAIQDELDAGKRLVDFIIQL